MAYIPFSSHQNRETKAPTQVFSKKHRGAPGNPNSPKNAARDTSGNASGKGQPNNKGVLQKAAGKRLFGGTPGAFAQSYKRD